MRMNLGEMGAYVPQFSPDNSLILFPMTDAAGDGGYGLWDGSGKLLGFLREDSYDAHFVPDGKHIVLEYPRRPVLILANDSFTSPIVNVSVDNGTSWEIESVRSSPSVRQTQASAVGSESATETGYDDTNVRNGMPKEVFDHLCAQFGKPTASARDSAGKRLVTGGDDTTLRFWDMQSWREVATFRMPAAIKSCEFSADDSQLIVVMQDDSGQIWEHARCCSAAARAWPVD